MKKTQKKTPYKYDYINRDCICNEHSRLFPDTFQHRSVIVTSQCNHRGRAQHATSFFTVRHKVNSGLMFHEFSHTYLGALIYTCVYS